MLPARPENVIVVRQAVAGLGEALQVPSRRIDDLKTVVTEACNNVVLHAYEQEEGPLEVTALATEEEVELRVIDRGQGFHPSGGVGEEPSLGLGLPLIASLSDSFEIHGAAGEGTRMLMRFALGEKGTEERSNGVATLEPREELELKITAGSTVRPVLARVIGALATRAEFSVERLEDTMLLGDAVSAHQAADFPQGRLGISIKDGDGTLDVKVGPLVEGAGERILEEMEVPGGGSLRRLARSMEVTRGEAEDGSPAEFLVFEVSS